MISLIRRYTLAALPRVNVVLLWLRVSSPIMRGNPREPIMSRYRWYVRKIAQTDVRYDFLFSVDLHQRYARFFAATIDRVEYNRH